MEIHAFTLGSFGVSAYVVVEGGEALLVDAPGVAGPGSPRARQGGRADGGGL
jgi:hypothetical protein